MSIVEKIEKYIADDRRDTAHEQQLLKELRKQSQEQRYKTLKPHLNRSCIALIFAQKAGLSPDAYREIWNDGLEYSNPSSIQWWVVTVASNLGWYKTFSLFETQIETGNVKIGEAIYHVPYIFDKLRPDLKAKNYFVELVQKASDLGLLRFNPDSVWGSGWRA